MESLGKRLGLFMVIVGDILGYTGAGFGIGYWIYRKWDGPIGLALLGGILGLFGAFYKIYRLTEKLSQEEEAEKTSIKNSEKKQR